MNNNFGNMCPICEYENGYMRWRAKNETIFARTLGSNIRSFYVFNWQFINVDKDERQKGVI